ncbi:MAG: hypothetical protein NW223_02700 [Hyphomicrobiaceae bacterium]|nr:hypothetical protein [Hyphomicrobiaceae bacterium]
MSDSAWLFQLIEVPEGYLRHWRRTADLATDQLPSLPTAIHALEPRARRASLLSLATFLRFIARDFEEALRCELIEMANEMQATAEAA